MILKRTGKSPRRRGERGFAEHWEKADESKISAPCPKVPEGKKKEGHRSLMRERKRLSVQKKGQEPKKKKKKIRHVPPGKDKKQPGGKGEKCPFAREEAFLTLPRKEKKTD